MVGNRAKRAEGKQLREPRKPRRPPIQSHAPNASRNAQRESASGLDQLEIWLADIIGQGLAGDLRSRARLLVPDGQSLGGRASAPGLARRVGDPGELATASQWQDELLAGLARPQLLIDGYRGIDRLPLDLDAEVRSLVGWTQEQVPLVYCAGTRDRRQAIARRQIEDDTSKPTSPRCTNATSNAFA